MCLMQGNELKLKQSRVVGGSNDGPRDFTADQQVAKANFPVLRKWRWKGSFDIPKYIQTRQQNEINGE